MLGNILVEGLEIKITQFPNGFCLILTAQHLTWAYTTITSAYTLYFTI